LTNPNTNSHLPHFGKKKFGLSNVLRELPGEHYLKGFDPERFARRAGFYMGEINAIHPFRDGNGRAQREFIRELGIEAGFGIDWDAVTVEHMMTASVESFTTGNSSGLAGVILLCMK
jgi:cell filamentation protein